MAYTDSYPNTSGNATPERSIKRMKLTYDDTSITFAVNPEDYTQSTPSKVTITQTKGGAWIDAWGEGLTEFTIKGITGLYGSSKEKVAANMDTGYSRWRELRKLFKDVSQAVTDGEEVKNLVGLYNYTDNEYWWCYPSTSGIELYRSKSRPNVYQYTIHLIGIREMGQPATESTGVIGDPNKSSSKTGSTSTTSSTKGKTTVKSGDADQVTYTIGSSTKSIPVETFLEDCRTYYKELEPLIGGKGGKISPITGYMCTKNLTMQQSGTVSNVEPFTAIDFVEESKIDQLTAEIKFQSKVSVETYNMVQKIKDYDPDVLSTAYSYISGTTRRERIINAVSKSTAYDSTLYSLIVQYKPKYYLTKTEINRLKIIILESMYVYRELYRIYNSGETEITSTLTLTNIDTLISNIRAMILYLSLTSTDINEIYRMDIVHELRELEKTITQVNKYVVNYL